MTKVEVKESAAGEALTASKDHQPTPLKEKIAKLGYDPAAKTALLLMLVKLEEVCAKGGQVTGEGAYNWASVIRMTRKLVSNRLSGLWQASPPPGYVKISWMCVSSRPQPPSRLATADRVSGNYRDAVIFYESKCRKPSEWLR